MPNAGQPGGRFPYALFRDRTHSGDNGLVIPNAGGTYALALWCGGSRRRVRIGRLGVLQLRPGWYVYIGSAFGTGGLRARVNHHRRVARRPHWHVDYLRRRTRLVAVWYISGARCEHQWAQRLGGIPGAATPLAGFGSSDCDCMTHLLQFEKQTPAAAIRLALRLRGAARTGAWAAAPKDGLEANYDPSTTDFDYHKRPR
jgi:Uri superfamily endonuclease